MRTIAPRNERRIPTEATKVFSGVVYDVYHWRQKMFDGREETFEMLRRPDTVHVIVVHDDKIMAITDTQPGRTPQFKLPGGRHDVATETELDCAKREVYEETGLRCASWKLLHAVQPAPKIDYAVYTFVASNVTAQDAPQADAGGEIIKLHPISFKQAKEIAAKGDNAYWPNDIFRSAQSINELLALPEYTQG